MDDDAWIDDAWIDEVLESSSHRSHRESRREKPRAEAEVIDVDADDATLAEQLSKTLNQAEVLGLATLQAARSRRAERRSAVPAHADVVDVDDEASTDLLHEQRQRLPAFLRENERQLPVTDIAMNPHSLPGTPLYERFFAAWAHVPNKSMRLVFHGTSEENIDAICREGLDPKRRRGQAMGPGEYFGGQPAVSLGYCRGGRKMLVFCILTDPSGVTQFNEQIPGGVAVIHKPEHQLPLAVVTFDPYKLTEAPARLGKKKKSSAAQAARAGRARYLGGAPLPAAANPRQVADAAAAAPAPTELEKMSDTELRAELQKSGRPTSGLRPSLLEAVRSAREPAPARPMPAPSLQVRRVGAAARAAAAQGIRPIPMRRVDLEGKEVAAAKAPMPPPEQHPEEYARWRKRRRDEVDERRRDEDDEDDELQRALKLSMRRQVDERKEDDEMRRAIALSMRVF